MKLYMVIISSKDIFVRVKTKKARTRTFDIKNVCYFLHCYRFQPKAVNINRIHAHVTFFYGITSILMRFYLKSSTYNILLLILIGLVCICLFINFMCFAVYIASFIRKNLKQLNFLLNRGLNSFILGHYFRKDD